MVSEAAATFAISLFVFGALLFLVWQERKRGERYFARSVRNWLDRVIDATGVWFLQTWDHFVKYVVQLNWYYSIHSILRTVLRLMVAMYTRFENVFERNRARTKKLRAEKRQLGEMSHLQKMAEHKKATALTPAEQRKLKKKKLEGK